MSDDHYRKEYPQHGRPEDNRHSHYPPPPEDSARSGDAPRPTMSGPVTLPSIHDHRASGYGPPGAARPYPPEARYVSPNTVNGFPPPGQQQPHPSGYLPPMHPQGDPRAAAYPPPDQRGAYYDDRRGQPYSEQYAQDPYFYQRGPSGPPAGYPRDYRGPPPGHYGPEYAQGAPPNVAPMAQAAPRQRTSIACRYCRKRKIRCSGYQSAPGGKCQNCARMNQDCVFQPVSSSSSTAFIPVSAVPGGVPPGTQLFGAYGQPLPNVPPHHQPYPPTAGQQPAPAGYYQAPMHSPTESFSSYGDPRGDDGSLASGRRRRRTPEEQDEGYRLPPPRAGPQEEEARRRSPAEFSNHSSPGGLGFPPYGAQRHSPRGAGGSGPPAASGPGGRSPVTQTESSGASTPARQAGAVSSGQPQQGNTSVMSLSNLVDKNDIDKTMIDRLNRPGPGGK